MALTLGTTGMDAATESEVHAAFKSASADLGDGWTLSAGDNADYVVVDMDSLYGPMSWLRLHAAGRKVIGLTSMERVQTDYRLPRPVSATAIAQLLDGIANEADARTAATAPQIPVAASAPGHEPEPAPEPAVRIGRPPHLGHRPLPEHGDDHRVARRDDTNPGGSAPLRRRCPQPKDCQSAGRGAWLRTRWNASWMRA